MWLLLSDALSGSMLRTDLHPISGLLASVLKRQNAATWRSVSCPRHGEKEKGSLTMGLPGEPQTHLDVRD